MSSALEVMRERRAASKKELDELLSAPTSEKRALSDDEDAKFTQIVEEIRKQDERIGDLEAQEKRERDAGEARKLAGDIGEQRTSSASVKEAPVYSKHNPDTSYFRDLFAARVEGDHQAAERLRRSAKAAADEIRSLGDVERRALGNTGAAGGSGGEFAPPLWLVSEFVNLARPGRKFADSLNPQNLPSGVSSVNLPRITGGTTTAIQTTQNTALSQTDMTTGSVSSNIATIGGKQVVSLQLLQQSGIPFDQVVLRDLAADYAKQFGNQVINGSGSSGQLNGVYTYFAASGTVNITYTQATPAVGGAGGLYAKIFGAAAAIETARFMPPDTIWMHPRRWNWVLAASDSQNRPLVVPQGAAYNPVGSTNELTAQGVVGQIGGLEVVVDPNIVTNTGAGTNQDPVLVGVRGDLRVWESALQLESFTATYADSAGVLFRALAYSAAIPGRYTSSVAVINGTGLVAPTF